MQSDYRTLSMTVYVDVVLQKPSTQNTAALQQPTINISRKKIQSTKLCTRGVKLVARVRILWSSANAWPPNFVFEKFFFKRKKSFTLKLGESSYEVMVDNYYKSRVALRVTASEVMTFLGSITRFPEIVSRRSGDLQIMPWLLCREI